MERRKFMYLAGLGAAGAAIPAMPAWANTAIRSISTALLPRKVLDGIIQYATDEQGNLHYRVVGSGVGWQRVVYNLDNVIININPASLDPIVDDTGGSGSGLSLLNWNYGMPGYPSIMDTLAEVTNSPVYQGVNHMMSSIAASLSGLSVGAAALKIADEIPNFLGVTGKVVAGIGVIDNAIQMYKEGINWTDAVQTVAGIVLIGVALANPVGVGVATAVFIAEMGLFLWELTESEY